MHRHRRRGPSADRISRILRDSLEADSVREAGDRLRTFIHEKPLLTACLGLAAGFMLGFLVRRR